MRKYLIIILMLIAQSVYAQEKKTDQSADKGARTANTNATSVVFEYDPAGNRIKRTGGVGSGCLNIWTGNVSASWNNAANWSLGIVPQPSHTVVIPALTSKPYPNLDVNTTIANIQFTGGIINTNNFNITLDLTSTCP